MGILTQHQRIVLLLDFLSSTDDIKSNQTHNLLSLEITTVNFVKSCMLIFEKNSFSLTLVVITCFKCKFLGTVIK